MFFLDAGKKRLTFEGSARFDGKMKNFKRIFVLGIMTEILIFEVSSTKICFKMVVLLRVAIPYNKTQPTQK